MCTKLKVQTELSALVLDLREQSFCEALTAVHFFSTSLSFTQSE
jgi:hypothetical protein